MPPTGRSNRRSRNGAVGNGAILEWASSTDRQGATVSEFCHAGLAFLSPPLSPGITKAVSVFNLAVYIHQYPVPLAETGWIVERQVEDIRRLS